MQCCVKWAGEKHKCRLCDCVFIHPILTCMLLYCVQLRRLLESMFGGCMTCCCYPPPSPMGRHTFFAVHQQSACAVTLLAPCITMSICCDATAFVTHCYLHCCSCGLKIPFSCTFKPIPGGRTDCIANHTGCWAESPSKRPCVACVLKTFDNPTHSL